MDGTRVRRGSTTTKGRTSRRHFGRSIAEVPTRRCGSGRGDVGIRADGGGGSRTFGETNGVTGSGSERIAGVGGEDGERGERSGVRVVVRDGDSADTSGDRGARVGAAAAQRRGRDVGGFRRPGRNLWGLLPRGEYTHGDGGGGADGNGAGTGRRGDRGWIGGISRCYGRATR